MPKARKDIEYLPSGWQWVPEGEETWTTYIRKKGQGLVAVQSTAKHARRGAETKSVRQVQNIQHDARIRRGQTIAPRQRRTGKIRTIKTVREEGENTIAGEVGSLYNPARRGRVETLDFYSMAEAQIWMIKHYEEISWAEWGMLQVKYTERLVKTSKVGSDVLDKNGYASLTTFTSREDIQDVMGHNVPMGSAIPGAWDIAARNIRNYDMTGKNARFYIYLAEKDEAPEA